MTTEIRFKDTIISTFSNGLMPQDARQQLAKALDISEKELSKRIKSIIDEGTLTRLRVCLPFQTDDESMTILPDINAPTVIRLNKHRTGIKFSNGVSVRNI